MTLQIVWKDDRRSVVARRVLGARVQSILNQVGVVGVDR